MRIEDFQNLLKANRILASTLEIDKLLNIVLELAADVVQAETGSVLIKDEKTDELVFNIALGTVGTELKTIRLKIGEGIAGWVAKENKAAIVNDPQSDPRWTAKADKKTKFVTRSILCVPMIHQGNLLGVVQTINKKGSGGFTEEDQTVLEAFSAQVAVAIQNARLFTSLRLEKEKVEMILSKMTEGAILTNETGSVLVANPSARNLLGLSDSLTLQIWKLFESYTISPSLEQFISSSIEVGIFEITRKIGKSFILAGAIKKILSDKKELMGYLVILRDVTSEKKEERLKKDFLSLISHKLRTPLVAITGYTPLLFEDEEYKNLNPFFKKAIESIDTQSQQLKGLVEKLISFSLIESEVLHLNKKPVNIHKMLQGCVQKFDKDNRDSGLILRLNLHSETFPEVSLDEEKFRISLECLIENAIKFNKKEEKKVTIECTFGLNHCAIAVKDNGPGIPPEESEKIFQKFYQIEESFTGQVQGAGLGLPVAKKFIEAHGGGVLLESKIGEGSTFTIRLPLK